MRWAGHVVHLGEVRKAYTSLVAKCEGTRPIRRPRHRWEYNIRMGFRKIWWEGVEWMHLA